MAIPAKGTWTVRGTTLVKSTKLSQGGESADSGSIFFSIGSSDIIRPDGQESGHDHWRWWVAVKAPGALSPIIQANMDDHRAETRGIPGHPRPAGQGWKHHRPTARLSMRRPRLIAAISRREAAVCFSHIRWSLPQISGVFTGFHTGHGLESRPRR